MLAQDADARVLLVAGQLAHPADHVALDLAHAQLGVAVRVGLALERLERRLVNALCCQSGLSRDSSRPDEEVSTTTPLPAAASSSRTASMSAA